MSGSVSSSPAYRFLKRQVRWSVILTSLRIFQFVVIHTVKGFGIVNKAGRNIFLEFCCLFDDPTGVGNLIPGSSVFSKSSLNIWSSWFTYCGSLAWRILNITLLALVQLCGSLSILWHGLSLGLEWKLTFSSPVATAQFSKFAGLLRAALSQHHLLGFKIAQLEFHHLHNFVCSDTS